MRRRKFIFFKLEDEEKFNAEKWEACKVFFFKPFSLAPPFSFWQCRHWDPMRNFISDLLFSSKSTRWVDNPCIQSSHKALSRELKDEENKLQIYKLLKLPFLYYVSEWSVWCLSFSSQFNSEEHLAQHTNIISSLKFVFKHKIWALNREHQWYRWK